MTITVGDLLERGATLKTGPFGTTLSAAEYSAAGVPVVSVGEVGEGRIEVGDRTRRVDAEVTARLSEYLLEAGDIVFARKGAVERTAQVQPYEAGYFLGSDGLRLRVGSSADPRFVALQLRTQRVRDWLLQHAGGTTLLSLNQETIRRIPLILPPRSTQRAIADVLGALDEKIAANATVAQACEDLLSAHFTALQAGGSGHPVRVDELVELNPRCEPLPSREAVYLDMQKLPITGSQIFDWGRREPRGGARFMNGDTVLARITPCLENRKAGFIDFLHESETALGSTEFIVLRSRPGIAKPLSFVIAIDEGFRAHAIQHMVGTSGRQRVAASDLATYEFSLPHDREPLVRLGELATAAFELLARQRDESRQLAVLRDTLLPHLMSGRISVREAETAVEEVL